MTMKIAAASGAPMLDALKALANGGTLVLYSGTQPANPDTALSGNTALATFQFSATAFGADSLVGGFQQATASFAAQTVTAVASGTAAFGRVYKSDGTTAVADLSVTATGGGGDIQLNSTAVSQNGSVTLSSLLFKMPVD